jgi:hypothetical protein
VHKLFVRLIRRQSTFPTDNPQYSANLLVDTLLRHCISLSGLIIGIVIECSQFLGKYPFFRQALYICVKNKGKTWKALIRMSPVTPSSPGAFFELYFFFKLAIIYSFVKGLSSAVSVGSRISFLIFPWSSLSLSSISVFLNRRAAARYRALASITPGRENFSF